MIALHAAQSARCPATRRKRLPRVTCCARSLSGASAPAREAVEAVTHGPVRTIEVSIPPLPLLFPPLFARAPVFEGLYKQNVRILDDDVSLHTFRRQRATQKHSPPCRKQLVSEGFGEPRLLLSVHAVVSAERVTLSDKVLCTDEACRYAGWVR